MPSSGPTGFGACLGSGFGACLFAASGSAAGRQRLGMAHFVATGGTGSERRFIGGFGVVSGGGVSFRSRSIVVSYNFRSLRYYFLTAHRHQKITLGALAETQIFFAGQLGNGDLLLILGLGIAPSQEQGKDDK